MDMHHHPASNAIIRATDDTLHIAHPVTDTDTAKGNSKALALSLDEVHELLSHLASQKHSFVDQYRSLIASNQAALTDFHATAHEFRSSRSALKHDLAVIDSRFFSGKDALAPAVASSVRDHERRAARLAEIKHSRQLLTQAHDIHSHLQSSIEHARERRYDRSATALASAYKHAQSAAAAHSDLLVYRDAVKAVERHMRGLSARVCSMIDGMITRTTSESGSIVVCIRHKHEPTDTLTLSDLLSALQLLDGDATNVTFTSSIRDRFTVDLLSHPFVVSHDAATVTFTLDAPIPAQSPDAIITGIRAYAYALANSVPTEITRSILDTVFEQAIAHFLPKHVPESASGLDDFKTIVDQIQVLATDLAARGLVSTRTSESISAYSPHGAFSLHRQESVLDRTRSMLLRVNTSQLESILHPALVDTDTIAHVTHVIQQQAAAAKGRPTLTLTSKSLLLTRADPLALPSPFPIPTYVHEFTRALVEEWQLATASSPSSTENGGGDGDGCLSLVASMLDIFFLYTRATYLSGRRSSPPPSARSVALAHNGCMYVADTLTRLCLSARLAAAAAAWQPAVTRQVPRVLQVAKDLVNAHVSAARSEVVKMLAPLESLWVDVVKHRERIQEVLLRVVARVKAEAESLKGIAPTPIRNYWLGATYDAALHSILNELYSWTDITAAESEELCSLLQTLLIPAHHFAPAAGAAAPGDPRVPWAPHYAAYHAVVELLNLSLRDILDKFRARRYAGCLTVDQLTRLVVALFQDSEVRSGALAEMAGGVRLGLVLPGAAAAAGRAG